ncbi:VOC family protein [Conexibacter woesei]|uniref:Glyoxalase/bleomycin resistance protein/dioxygenase n=1 Tax=Conexibacter woesei (strain DSM 14684 / CCUG 47730 / CIP 108061 / JCM 11494 / NBRC 100937 / ID131577) TaxID=469383 RepID=D3F875_CONWI|nr:VOC family protein [Conexibacter woesei]ADB48945.1 Glyoxalase/bleomycin resistance protein/dioxygenase [Conexibacter woesei DSM 14684]
MNLSYLVIYVPDVPAALSFYESAFGLRRRFLHESQQFGELDTGTTALAFTSHALAADAVPLRYRPLRPADEAAGFELTLTTDDVAAAFDHAVAAGASGVAVPQETPWGQTVAYVRDHVGTAVGLATPMA